MRPAEIAQLLSRNAEEVAKHLLPNGKRDGHEWRCGSLSGEAGKSLGIHLHGEKAGVWSDFATGQSGDLLDLWREVRNLGMPDAMTEAASSASTWKVEKHISCASKRSSRNRVKSQTILFLARRHGNT